MSTRVLIVEDTVVVARNLSDRLQELGYVVLGTASTGEQAVALAAATKPDLVLMDIRLQGEMDGIQAAAEIRRQQDVPIVYLTGYADEATLKRAKATLPHGYLLKPIDARELHSTIDMAVHRHAMERQLRASEAQYRALVEQSRQAIAIVQDLPPRLVFANPGCSEVSGYALDELLSMSPQELAELVHPQDREQVQAWLAEVVSRRTARHSGEFRIVGKDASALWLEGHAAYTERDGQPAAQVSLVDISRRKRAEEALRRAHDELGERVRERSSEPARADLLLTEQIAEHKQAQETLQQCSLELAQLSAAIDQTADAVVVTDPNGYIVYVNRAFEQISGHRGGEVTGQHPNLLQSDTQGDALYHEVCEAMTTGQAWHGRLPIKKKDGTFYATDATVTPVRNQAGQIVNYVASMRDVSFEASLEEQVRHAQKMEALGRLAGGIAHDFNNLLTAIELGTRIIEGRLLSDDPLWQDVQRIRDTTKRATDLTRQLLNFSRREPCQLQVLDLSLVAQDLYWMLQRLIGSDIQLEAVLAKDLWPVEANPTQMEQVIMNLVVNARDAMPLGGTLTIETANVILGEADARAHLDTQPGPYVLLTVTDTGLGMSEEVQAHVFEPFFTTKEQRRGTGLGLAIVFGIVSQTGGHIRVRSEEGKGTTFEVYLPKTDKAESQPERVPAAAVPSQRRCHETILVVEDDAVIRELTVRILASRGYRVQAAADGQEALEISEKGENDIQLLLTDLLLPKIGGWDLSERLLELMPGIQVVYMTGYGEESKVVKRVLDAGRPLLAKPFDVATLVDKVQAALDARSWEGEVLSSQRQDDHVLGIGHAADSESQSSAKGCSDER